MADELNSPNGDPKKGSAVGLITAVVIVALIAGYFIFRNNGNTDQVASNDMTGDQMQNEQIQPPVDDQQGGVLGNSTTTPDATSTPDSQVKTFTVEGKNFSFSPSVITVNKGDTVQIVFKNSGGFHDWVLDEFNAKTKTINDGQTDTIQFVADKTGTFEFYCGVGNHRQMGMKGSFIVQ